MLLGQDGKDRWILRSGRKKECEKNSGGKECGWERYAGNEKSTSGQEVISSAEDEVCSTELDIATKRHEKRIITFYRTLSKIVM